MKIKKITAFIKHDDGTGETAHAKLGEYFNTAFMFENGMLEVSVKEENGVSVFKVNGKLKDGFYDKNDGVNIFFPCFGANFSAVTEYKDGLLPIFSKKSTNLPDDLRAVLVKKLNGYSFLKPLNGDEYKCALSGVKGGFILKIIFLSEKISSFSANCLIFAKDTSPITLAERIYSFTAENDKDLITTNLPSLTENLIDDVIVGESYISYFYQRNFKYNKDLSELKSEKVKIYTLLKNEGENLLLPAKKCLNFDPVATSKPLILQNTINKNIVVGCFNFSNKKISNNFKASDFIKGEITDGYIFYDRLKDTGKIVCHMENIKFKLNEGECKLFSLTPITENGAILAVDNFNTIEFLSSDEGYKLTKSASVVYWTIDGKIKINGNEILGIKRDNLYYTKVDV